MKYIVGVCVAAMFAMISACEPINRVDITIELNEFSYSPDVIELQVGQVVTLMVVNNGALEHEIMFGRTVMMMADAANGYTVDMFEFAGIEPQGMFLMGAHDAVPHEHNPDGSEIEPEDDVMAMDIGSEEMTHSGYMTVVNIENNTATIVFEVTEAMLGEWEFGCFLAQGSHFTAGMSGTLVVTN